MFSIQKNHQKVSDQYSQPHIGIIMDEMAVGLKAKILQPACDARAGFERMGGACKR